MLQHRVTRLSALITTLGLLSATEAPAQATIKIDTLRDERTSVGKATGYFLGEFGKIVRKVPQGSRQRLVADTWTSEVYDRFDYVRFADSADVAIACAVRADSSFIVVDGVPSPTGSSICPRQFDDLAISPNGKHWIAKLQLQIGVYTVIADGVRFVQVKEPVVQRVTNRHSFVVLRNASNGGALRTVIDGKEVVTATPATSASGTPAPQDEAFVHVVQATPGWRVLVNGVQQRFTNVAWFGGAATAGSRWSVLLQNTDGTYDLVVDGTVKVRALKFGPNPRVETYLAPRGKAFLIGGENRSWVDHTGLRTPTYQGIGHVVFSEDGEHYAFAAQSAAGMILVVDGQEVGELTSKIDGIRAVGPNGQFHAVVLTATDEWQWIDEKGRPLAGVPRIRGYVERASRNSGAPIVTYNDTIAVTPTHTVKHSPTSSRAWVQDSILFVTSNFYGAKGEITSVYRNGKLLVENDKAYYRGGGAYSATDVAVIEEDGGQRWLKANGKRLYNLGAMYTIRRFIYLSDRKIDIVGDLTDKATGAEITVRVQVQY